MLIRSNSLTNIALKPFITTIPLKISIINVYGEEEKFIRFFPIKKYMSFVSKFYEELEKELNKTDLGLSIDDVKDYERRGENLIIYLKNGLELISSNNYLIELAKEIAEEEKIESILPKSALLKRLYLLENMLVGKRKWKGFLKSYSSCTRSEILRKIREIESNNLVHLPKLKEYAIDLISSALGQSGVYYSNKIKNQLYTKSFQELAEVFVNISTEKITSMNLERLLNIK